MKTLKSLIVTLSLAGIATGLLCSCTPQDSGSNSGKKENTDPKAIESRQLQKIQKAEAFLKKYEAKLNEYEACMKARVDACASISDDLNSMKLDISAAATPNN